MRSGDGGAGEQRSSDLKLHSCAGGHQLSPQSPGFKRSSSFGETSPVAAKLSRFAAPGLSDAAVARTNGSFGGANGSRHLSTSSTQPQPQSSLECSFCQQSGFANAFSLNLHVSAAHPREQLLKVHILVATRVTYCTILVQSVCSSVLCSITLLPTFNPVHCLQLRSLFTLCSCSRAAWRQRRATRVGSRFCRPRWRRRRSCSR